MVDITDHPGFLYCCKKQGCDVIVLPMTFLEGISKNTRYIEDRLAVLYDNDRHFGFKPIVLQLIGKKIEAIKDVFNILSSYEIQGVNLNMGCPSGRIKAQGLGASILDRPKDRDAVIDAVLKSSPVPLSIKMRLFGKEKSDVPASISFCKMLETKGIDWVAVHGRTGRQRYTGPADWNAIKEIHEATSLPLVGNGDITCWNHGKRLVDEGSCDAFMIGRAAWKDPRVFSHSYNTAAVKTMADALVLFREITGFVIANRGHHLEPLLVSHEIRKVAVALSRQVRGGKKFRDRAVKASTIDEIEALFVSIQGTSR
nr:tRNA-dihydrouridine synthase family protein [Candidatus Sigynarchaeota archaeon]